jgi:hypothetical protein
MPKLSISASHAFDLGVAALAAVSAGFLVFAMPGPLFSGIIGSTPLPDYFAAAQPPLGATARLAAVGAVGLFTFAFVWSLLAALDRLPRPSSAAAPEFSIAECEAPRLRRADSHPDAPSRRPLVAGRDLGEPLLLEDVDALPAELPKAAEPEPEPASAIEPEPETPVVAQAPAEPEGLSDLAARLPEAGDSEGSLTELVSRIESGFGRKRQALEPKIAPPRPPVEASEEPPLEEERVGHRLRSAISELQKISARA